MERGEEYDFTETHEHPEGGDRGGYGNETHTFGFINGAAYHNYDLDVGDDPGSFGLDESTLERLTTKEDAIHFVANEIAELETKLREAQECKKRLEEATSYMDRAEYRGYDEEDEDDDDE